MKQSSTENTMSSTSPHFDIKLFFKQYLNYVRYNVQTAKKTKRTANTESDQI